MNTRTQSRPHTRNFIIPKAPACTFSSTARVELITLSWSYLAPFISVINPTAVHFNGPVQSHGVA